MAFDEIVEFHNDTFLEDNFDQRTIGAEVLGRKAQLFLNKSEKLSARIHQVLASNLQDVSKSQIARKWARTLDSDVEYAYSILEAFQNGILKS